MKITDGKKTLFSHEELSCNCGCKTVHLHPQFADDLKDLRVMFGKPIRPTSVCRCPAHNKTVGGHHRSLHLTTQGRNCGTLAIDVPMADSKKRRALVATALKMGWSVGIASTFVHLDRRDHIGLKPALFHYMR